MKKLKYLVAVIVSMLVFPSLVSAASGKINVTGTNTVVVGNTVTVTVTLSSNTPIGSWEMSLNYDKNYLKLASSTAEAGGTYMANVTSSTAGVKSKSYTFTFKTLKKGSTNVSLSSYYVVANDMSDMSITAGSKKIKIITQQELEASYSKDNNLKSLNVDGFDITPEFNKDTLEYSVVVPENTKEVTINGVANDNKSSITGLGTKEVTLGTNSFDIVVRAQNGAEKTYKLVVEVKDASPINVTIDNSNYTVVKIKENLPAANYYSEYTVNINSFEIPAYKNDNTGIVLVGLKNNDGNISLFMYDEKTSEYKKYTEVGVNKITIYPLHYDQEIKGYTKGTISLNNEEVEAYYHDKDSDFALIYGINIETGEKALHLYDKKNQTLTKYNDEYINELQDRLKLYSYIIIGFSIILVVMFILLIAVNKSKKKKKRKTKPEVIEEVKPEKKENEIVEITNDQSEEEKPKEEVKGKKKKSKKRTK